MKENYETIELCNMIAERKYEVALAEATKKISALESSLETEKKSTFSKVDIALFKGFILGGAMATFLLLALLYALS